MGRERVASPLKAVSGSSPGPKTSRPVVDGLMLPAEAPTEPVWSEWFLEDDQAAMFASREWARVVPLLEGRHQLSTVDATTLADYCVCATRIVQLERVLSEAGFVHQSERGATKHPATAILNGYRTNLRAWSAKLGLSPRDRRGLTDRGGDESDADDPFD